MSQQAEPVGNEAYDVAIVGGGPAGLSAALMLVRARRSVVIVDSGQSRNAPAAHSHGFLTRDGAPPAEFLAAARREVSGYGGEIVEGRAESARRTGEGFVVELDGGRSVQARRLLAAAGLVDELPDIPGLAARWGRDVLHCPYCHGWEFRDRPIGVLVTNPVGMHQALMFRQWTAHLTVLTHDGPGLGDDQAEQLAARDVAVVAGEVAAVETTEDRLTGVRMGSGELVALSALVVSPRVVPRAGVLVSLGIEPTPHPTGQGSFISADPTGLTAEPGVWAAGNLVDPVANVLASAAAGARAAGAINADLVAEETRTAVQKRRVDRSHM
jgi:thioredoxin reductase